MSTENVTPHPAAARRSKGLTQIELAAAAGCSQQTVMRAEQSGRYPVVLALRRAYLAALGLPTDAEDPTPATAQPVGAA